MTDGRPCPQLPRRESTALCCVCVRLQSGRNEQQREMAIARRTTPPPAVSSYNSNRSTMLVFIVQSPFLIGVLYEVFSVRTCY